MNASSKRWRIVSSLGFYIILGILVVIALRYTFFEDIIPFFLVTFLLFVIRDLVSIYGIPKKMQHRSLDWARIHADRYTRSIKTTDMLMLVNRIYIFPGLLLVYVFFSLSRQLDIFGLMDILSARPQIEWWILGVVAISGLLTIFREDLDDTYIRLVTNYSRTRQAVFVILILSVLAVVIVFRETSSLGLLSIPMSLMSGLLIFLLGLTLLEEEHQE